MLADLSTDAVNASEVRFRGTLEFVMQPCFNAHMHVGHINVNLLGPFLTRYI